MRTFIFALLLAALIAPAQARERVRVCEDKQGTLQCCWVYR